MGPRLPNEEFPWYPWSVHWLRERLVNDGHEGAVSIPKPIGSLTSNKSPVTFTERLMARRARWWGPPRWPAPQWGGPRGLRNAIHQELGERRAFRLRDEPESRWRCCEFWPRTLSSKWNSHEFAARHGCPVPELYWRGSSAAKLPIDTLPEHFVVRKIYSSEMRGVLAVAHDRDLIQDRPIVRAEIGRLLARTRYLKRGVPIMIEQFVRAQDGEYRLPLEIKCHVFGEYVAAVQVVESKNEDLVRQRFYTTSWEPIEDRMNVGLPQDEQIRPRPHDLERLLGLARTLGAAVGTYARLDFFLSDSGWFFNECSTIPFFGLHNTPYCDALFGAAWTERIPNRI